MIIRGTTPYHNFTLPLAADEVQSIYATYFQENKKVLEKGTSEFEIIDIEDLYENASMGIESDEANQSVASVHLTQEDTLRFKYYFEPNTRRNFIFVQLTVVDTNGEVYRSIPLKQRLVPAFKDNVIEGGV